MVMFTGTPATVREIPHIGYLLARELILCNKIFTQAAVYVPAPAFATAGTPLVRVGHRIIVCRLFFRRKREVIVSFQLLCKVGGDIIRIARNLGDIAIFLKAFHLLLIAMDIHG